MRTEAKKRGATQKRARLKMKNARERWMHAEKKRFEGRELWGRMWGDDSGVP